jgi:hypothetical protein
MNHLPVLLEINRSFRSRYRYFSRYLKTEKGLPVFLPVCQPLTRRQELALWTLENRQKEFINEMLEAKDCPPTLQPNCTTQVWLFKIVSKPSEKLSEMFIPDPGSESRFFFPPRIPDSGVEKTTGSRISITAKKT